MNDAFYTQTGERADLAAVEVNPPEGYIGTKILPVVPVADKTGTVYYATVTADAAAETDRAVNSGPDATQISDTAGSFSTAEACRRGRITPDEAKQMGGIDKADIVGAKWAKRQVMNALEGAIRTDLLTGTPSATFDAAKILTQTQTALESIRLYEGKRVLFGATMTLKTIVQGILADSKSGPLFCRLVSGTSPAIAAQGLNFKQWTNALAMYMGVDEVMAGYDVIWNATAVKGRFAIAALDDGTDPLSHKWKPVLGKVFQFMPNGTNPWVIQSVADRVNVNNLYDAYLWYDSVILNSGALYLMDGAT